jgi:hypothetical protein
VLTCRRASNINGAILKALPENVEEGQSPWGNMLDGRDLRDNALSLNKETKALFRKLSKDARPGGWRPSVEELFFAAQWVARQGTPGVLRAFYENPEEGRPPGWEEVHPCALSVINMSMYEQVVLVYILK